jgi:predicted RecA/RadA family phage recombinase
MSWTTGTQTETLGANSAVGSALANSTVLTDINPPTGVAYCPANFWLPSYGVSKSLLVKAYGVLSTTATPTLTMAIYGDTAQGTPSGTPLATTGAVTMSSGVTNVPWSLEVVISNVTTGSSGTFLSDGIFIVYNAVTTATAWGGYRCSSSTANPNTASTLSTQSAYYIELAAAWGAASSSNTITCYSYVVLGLN